MIEFYFHYDSNTHKGRIVCVIDNNEIVQLVDKIICVVHTMTERKEVSPKFVVKGMCNSIIISTDELTREQTAYVQ